MYTLDDLSVRLLSELRSIADDLDIKGFKKIPKKDLIYKILDCQATLPENELKKVMQKQNSPDDSAVSFKERQNILTKAGSLHFTYK